MIHKTIMGTKNELKYSALGLMLEYYHINKTNATIVEHTFDLNDFIQKRVDVMSAFRSNQLFELKQQNIEYEIIEPFDFGFNMSAGNLFTSKDEAINHTQRTHAFIEASNKGWKYAIEHSDEIIDILIDKYGVKKSKDSLRFEAKEVKKLMMLDFFQIGEINDELTKLTFRQLKKGGFIEENEHLHNFVFDSIIKNINIDFSLSALEKNYLEQKKRIVVCVDPQWLPFEAIEHKKHIGIAADVMKNFEEKLAVPIEHKIVKTWQESINLAKKRECDIFSLASRTPSRFEYMNFTTPYLTLPIVIATTNDKLFTDDLRSLKNKKIAAVQGYSIIEKIKSKYPYLEMVEVKSINEGLKLVLEGKVYGYIDNLMVVSSYIQKDFTGILKVSSRLNDSLSFSVATRNDEPILNEIFEKLVQSLDEQTMQMIFNRWVSTIEEVSMYKKDFIIKALILFITIIAIFLYRQYLLQRYNKALLKLSITDKLTGLYNRLKTDEKLEEEHKKVLRYENYCCSILLIDVDHFKQINDHYGHHVGDKILQEIALVLKKSIRDTDIVGRWGGEEFLIILPNTNKKEAYNVGLKLKENIASYPFYATTQVTISLGGFELQKNMSVNEAMSQADVALYQSKNTGRNQVSVI
jgi:diguanylate cyclase (GGDEF)-like protein